MNSLVADNDKARNETEAGFYSIFPGNSGLVNVIGGNPALNDFNRQRLPDLYVVLSDTLTLSV